MTSSDDFAMTSCTRCTLDARGLLRFKSNGQTELSSVAAATALIAGCMVGLQLSNGSRTTVKLSSNLKLEQAVRVETQYAPAPCKSYHN